MSEDKDYMIWWWNISDSKTEDLILKYDMRKPIKEEKIQEVFLKEREQDFALPKEEPELKFSENELDFIKSALNEVWQERTEKLRRKDLGDIERKIYEAEKNEALVIAYKINDYKVKESML